MEGNISTREWIDKRKQVNLNAIGDLMVLPKEKNIC